jgi:hypothetical protein
MELNAKATSANAVRAKDLIFADKKVTSFRSNTEPDRKGGQMRDPGR